MQGDNPGFLLVGARYKGHIEYLEQEKGGPLEKCLVCWFGLLRMLKPLSMEDRIPCGP